MKLSKLQALAEAKNSNSSGDMPKELRRFKIGAKYEFVIDYGDTKYIGELLGFTPETGTGKLSDRVFWSAKFRILSGGTRTAGKVWKVDLGVEFPDNSAWHSDTKLTELSTASIQKNLKTLEAQKAEIELKIGNLRKMLDA